MPMELRKRKAPESAAAPEPKKAAPTKAKAAAPKTASKAAPKAAAKAAPKAAPKTAPKTAPKASPKAALKKEAAAAPAASKPKVAKKSAKDASTSSGLPEVDSVIDLDTFGGEIQTNDGETTSLKALVEASKSGVVLFTYPRASTPGCTKQACLFRDKYEPLTAGGLAIYGLSTDSPKANTTFKTNQKLPYPLLCDPEATLIEAIGLKKEPKGTTRGVFVVDKTGKVLIAEPGSPDGTVAAVQKLVESSKL